MNIQVFPTKQETGVAAARYGADIIRKALAAHGVANIIVATGASQFEMLSELIKAPGIDWGKVNIFHLDEYIGIPEDHPAGFRKYLRERFISQLPCPSMSFHPVSAEAMEELNRAMKNFPIDVAFVGIGENGHLAFNDPPADFDTEVPYIAITLDEACRRQQLGEGWFPTFEDVPKQAVSMSIRQILKSKVIVCTVPDLRKAKAVQGAVEGPVTNLCPSSILQTHMDCHLYMDLPAASLLKTRGYVRNDK